MERSFCKQVKVKEMMQVSQLDQPASLKLASVSVSKGKQFKPDF